VHASNGQQKRSRTLEAEHYNRELVEQERWMNLVVNRLELRAMGAQAGKNHSIEQIVQNWLKRLDAIDNEKRMQKLEQQLNDALYDKLTQGKTLSKATLNALISAHADYIYTGDQLRDLYARHGCRDPGHEVRNLKRSYPEAVASLCTKQQISDAIKQIRQAIVCFVEG